MRAQKQKARAYLVSELKRTAEDADTLVSMGSMFLTIGELDLSTHCLLRALDLDGANADAYYYLGLVSANKGRFEDAVEFFGHTLDINSDHIEALRDSTLLYLQMGRLDEAAKRINKARVLADDDLQLKKLARRIQLAQTVERIGDFLARFNPRFLLRKLLQ